MTLATLGFCLIACTKEVDGNTSIASTETVEATENIENDNTDTYNEFQSEDINEQSAESEIVVNQKITEQSEVMIGQEIKEVSISDLSELTVDNFPKFDGSTALRPLGVSIAEKLLNKSAEEVDGLFSFHKTDYAYYCLEEGYADILIVAQGCDEVMEDLDKSGFEYEKEPIAEEALVFVVNKNNPVNSLTSEQVKKIYAGEITNWSEVGGEDYEIKAFQRNEESGSQVMMRKCVMTDYELSEPLKEKIVGDMGGLIYAVAGYDNSPIALGYTVYYYADSMQMADGLKILSIDGIEPCNETIASKEYPFLYPYFCLIAKDAGENSPERLIYNWLVSDEGQKVVEEAGYVPIR